MNWSHIVVAVSSISTLFSIGITNLNSKERSDRFLGFIFIVAGVTSIIIYVEHLVENVGVK